MLKIDIISGFLGAGKTTFIKRLLETKLVNEKIVLTEEEFGDLAVAALGHKEVVVKGYAQTCSKDGKKDGAKCSRCGITLVAQETIKDDKVSHNGQHWINTIDYNTYEPGVYGWNLVEE